jgi:DNA-binding beta-propeller fold protein YncE
MRRILRGLIGMAAVLLWGPGLGYPAAASPAGAVPTALITNSQTQTMTVVQGLWSVRTINHVGKGPVGVAVTPNHRDAYVADYGFLGDVQSTVTPVDLTTGQVGHPIEVGTGPMAIAITPDGRYAVVTLQGAGQAPGHQLVRITLSTGAVSAPVEVGANPESVAVSPDGRIAYAAAFTGAKVTPVDLTVTPPKADPPILLPGTSPRAIAIAPNGATAYVADAQNATVIPIALATGTPGPPVDLVCTAPGDPGCTPSSIAITGSGDGAWVAAAGSNDVIELALPSLRKVKVLPAGGYPDAVAVGRGWLYCANGASNDVSIFRARVPLRTAPTGQYPIGVAVIS